ncbi:hypothetical protein QYF36_004068 [Acer negundo]|nr:hypothetical protein QYF36_004068 [Acer negundo]
MKSLLKKKEEEEELFSFADLPEHVVIKIIEMVPARYLYNTFRFICNSWNDMITSAQFTAQNTTVNQTKSELFIQIAVTWRKQDYKVKLLEMDHKGLDFKSEDFYTRMGKIRSSCDGLILVVNKNINGNGIGILYVQNLLTRSSLSLPKCPSDCRHEQCGAAIGFDHSKKQYKVVHMCADQFGYEIFTLGGSDDSWKRIPGPFEESYDRPFNGETFRWGDPVLINGQVMHWYVDSDEYAVSMNISDEKTYRTYFPDIGQGIDKERYKLLEMGRYLAFVYKVSSSQIDVWILKDYCHGQNCWVKRHSMIKESMNYIKSSSSSSSSKTSSKLQDHNPLPDFMRLFPVASLRDGEVIVFMHQTSKNVSGCLYFYEIRHMELKKFNLRMRDRSSFVPHRSSLIHWKHEKELLPKSS